MKLLTYLEKFDLLDRVRNAAGDDFDALEQWKFAINWRAKNRFGCCKYSKKLVEVTSEYYLHGAVKPEEMDDFINTLLHETAHILVKERFGSYINGRKIAAHGREWRVIMFDLGITNVKRCGSSTILNEIRKKVAKHTYTCKDCGTVIPRQRKLANAENRYHPKCKRKPNGGSLIHKQMR